MWTSGWKIQNVFMFDSLIHWEMFYLRDKFSFNLFMNRLLSECERRNFLKSQGILVSIIDEQGNGAVQIVVSE